MSSVVGALILQRALRRQPGLREPHVRRYSELHRSTRQRNTSSAVVKEDGTTELRGNDILLCLPDGDDDDVQSDGCVRIASLRDTDSEPTGIIFLGSGESMLVSLQHRATGVGALLRISGFEVRRHHRERRDGDWWPWGWGKNWKD